MLALRSLIDAMGKIERELRRRKLDCNGIVFIRNDVYELLIANSPDRGKVSSINLDWTDPLLRRRFLYSESEIRVDAEFEEIWRQIAVSHVKGEESSQYLIDRCLMRPRALIELVRFCRSHAVNLGHSRIEADDILHGEEQYSSEMLSNISFEVGDVYPDGAEILYEFIESSAEVPGSELRAAITRRIGEDASTQLLELLLWYGFLGVTRDNGETMYIYSVSYDMRRLMALVNRRGMDAARFRINPAFWRSLEVRA